MEETVGNPEVAEAPVTEDSNVEAQVFGSSDNFLKPLKKTSTA